MVSEQQVIWNSTPDEAERLTNILARNCTCTNGPFGVRITTCAGHEMMLHSQRALDGLIFASRIADRLWAEEQTPVCLYEHQLPE